MNTASPEAPVEAVVTPFSTPPPEAIAAETLTPACATALPETSASCTRGCTENATPACAAEDGCTERLRATALPAVTAMPDDTVPASPAEVNPIVRVPITPVMARSVKLTCPAASLARLAVPPSVPPPLAIAADTAMPACATALPAESRTCSTGCCDSTAPLATDPDGCTVMVSCAGAPAVTVTPADAVPPSDGAVKPRV